MEGMPKDVRCWYLTYIHTRYPFNNSVCSDDTVKTKSGSLERIIVKSVSCHADAVTFTC